VVTEVMGWDEAFLAVDTADPEAFARGVQERIRLATQLDSTVGIGENKLQAKLATGFGKPAGVYRLTHQTWFDVLGSEPVSALWGIGAKTAAKLAELGLRTVSELAAAEVALVAGRFGPTIGPWLVQTACGLDPSAVTAEPYVPRSRGREVTFQSDIEDWEQVRAEVVALAGRVAQDVAAEGRPAVRVVVKVRYKPFFTSTHGVPLAGPAGAVPASSEDAGAAAIEAAALAALELFTGRRPVRLLGVRAEFAAG
jgi:DNA polymerase-4